MVKIGSLWMLKGIELLMERIPQVTDYLTSIDPGDWAGFGFWADKVLVACGKFTEPDYVVSGKGNPSLERVFPLTFRGPCACERPRIYPQGKQEANPDTIITLSITAGRLTQRWDKDQIGWFHPREWKGNVPQPILETRIIEALTEAEALILYESIKDIAPSYRHNVFDAVGIGLYALKRCRSGIT